MRSITNSAIPVKLSIWQIYYDGKGADKLNAGFIPYSNENKLTIFYENEVLSLICREYKSDFQDSDYTGVVSWRFLEKTNVSFKDICNHINRQVVKKDVYSLTPNVFNHLHSPYSEFGFGNVYEICKVIDKYNLFPFKLTDHDSVNKNKFKCFCNFFICTPEIFEDYVNNYLNKLINFINTCSAPEFLIQINRMIKHRGVFHPVHPFLLEGLFECYVHYKQYSYDYIFNPTPFSSYKLTEIIKRHF